MIDFVKMLKKKIAVAKTFRLFYFDVLNDVIEQTASSSDDEKRVASV